MAPALSPMPGERCGRSKAGLDQPHHSTKCRRRARSSDSSRLGALKTCRASTTDLCLTGFKGRVLQCVQHPVRHDHARLTGDARSTRRPTIPNAGEMDYPGSLIRGLHHFRATRREETHHKSSPPRRRLFGIELSARSRESCAMSAEPGPGAGCPFTAHTSNGENMNTSKGFRSVGIHLSQRKRWHCAGDASRGDGSTARLEGSAVLSRVLIGTATTGSQQVVGCGRSELKAANGRDTWSSPRSFLSRRTESRWQTRL